MPSLVTEDPTESTTAFTLEFGDVNFRLDPKFVGAKIAFQHVGAKEVLFDLSSFSGTLRVTRNETEGSRASTVEDEDESPAPKRLYVSPRQQRLDFKTKPTHRRPKVRYMAFDCVC